MLAYGRFNESTYRRNIHQRMNIKESKRIKTNIQIGHEKYVNPK